MLAKLESSILIIGVKSANISYFYLVISSEILSFMVKYDAKIILNSMMWWCFVN